MVGTFYWVSYFLCHTEVFFRGHSIFIILNEVEIDKNLFHSKKCHHKFLWSIKNSSNCCKLSVKRCFHPRYNDRILMYWIFMSFFSSFYLKKTHFISIELFVYLLNTFYLIAKRNYVKKFMSMICLELNEINFDKNFSQNVENHFW